MKNQKNTLKEDILKSEKSLQQEDLSKKQDNSNYYETTDCYERIEVEETPFIVAKTPDGYVIGIKNYSISGTHETLEEAIKDAKSITWDRIVTVFGVMLEHANLIELKNLQK